MNISKDFFDIDQKLLRQEELILEATELLSTVMAENDITKADLARHLGKSKAYVTQCLAGGQNLTLRTLADLFGAIGYKIQLEAMPGAEEASKQIVRLYKVGGWALDTATTPVMQKTECEEPADTPRPFLLCEAA
jgi:transcriptional regulator with XRE-family HTH domain